MTLEVTFDLMNGVCLLFARLPAIQVLPSHLIIPSNIPIAINYLSTEGPLVQGLTHILLGYSRNFLSLLHHQMTPVSTWTPMYKHLAALGRIGRADSGKAIDSN